jgi:MFS family permease
MFPAPAEQARAIGAYAFTGAVGASVGLISGGLLVQYANWHWIFFVNLPIGVAAWLVAWRALPADRGLGLRAGADVPGALLATSGLMLAVFAIASPASAWWAATAGAALLAGFAVRQATARAPLLPPRALASRNVIGAFLSLLLIISAAQGFQVTVTLYMQRALRFGAAESGLGLAPTAVVIAVVSLGLSGRLTTRFGARRLLLAGLIMITAALALLVQVPAHASYAARLLPVFVLFGAGAGLTLTTVTALGMSGATDSDAGVISGAFNTMQQVGAALGVALLTSLAASRTGDGTSAQALTDGYHAAFAAGAIFAAVSAVVAALVLRDQGRPGADAPAAPAATGNVTTAKRR